MKTIGEIRLRNLEILVSELGTLEALAERAGSSSVYMSQIRKGAIDQKTGKPRQMGTAMARRIEEGCGKPAGWMDAPHDAAGSTSPAVDVNIEPVSFPHAGMVPLISWVQAGNFCSGDSSFEAIDAEEWFICPVPHSKRTYALRVRGLSMKNPFGRPTYDEGEIIFIDPEREAKPGDRVIACLEMTSQATFKQLMEEDGRIFLKALNPDWTPRIIELEEAARVCGPVIGKWTPE